MVINSLYISHCYAVQFPSLEPGLISEYSNQWNMVKGKLCRSESRHQRHCHVSIYVVFWEPPAILSKV